MWSVLWSERRALVVLLVLLAQKTACLAMSLSSEWKVSCPGEGLDKMNGCFNQYMMLEGGRLQVAGDLEKAGHWCARANESMDCASSLAGECLSRNSVRAMASLLAPHGTMNDLCSSPRALADLVHHSSCLAQFGGQIGQMIFNFSSLLLKSSKTQVSICCNFFALKESLASFDYSPCDNSSLLYMADLLNTFTVEIEDLLCPKIASSKDEPCQVTSVEEEGETGGPINTPPNFLNPFLALLLTLGDQWTGSE